MRNFFAFFVTTLLLIVLPAVADDYAAPTPQANDYYLNASTGSDSNDGSSAHPWQTLNAVPWNSLPAGKSVWMHTGTYAAPDIRNLSHNGTASQRITISSYPGEAATIAFPNCTSTCPLLEGGSYVDFRDFTFTFYIFGWNLQGSNPGYGAADNSDHIRFINVTGIKSGTDPAPGGNAGGIMLWSWTDASVDYIEIVKSKITGTPVSSNLSLIWVDRTRHLKIIGNLLDGASNTIYYKHNHQQDSGNVGILIQNNIFGDAGEGLNVAYATINNNVFYNGDLYFNDDGGDPAGDYNLITHNTFYGTGRLVINPPQTPRALGVNPFASVSGSTSTVVTANSFGVFLGSSVGTRFLISGATSNATHPTAIELNAIQTIASIIDSNSFTINLPSAATATGSVGGSNAAISSDLILGAYGNTVQNNVFNAGQYYENCYSDLSSLDQATSDDYNLYGAGEVICRNGNGYSLSSYQSSFTGKETHSITSGSIALTSGSPSVNTPSDWNLTAPSAALTGSTTGGKIGVDYTTLLTVNTPFSSNSLGPHSGDVNGDGQLTLGDVLLIQKYLLGQIALTADQIQRADVYPTGGDGLVTPSDLLALQQKVLHLSTH